MTKIKICGLRREQDIRYANELMPDYIGFVFLKGKMRYVTFEEAARFRSLLDPAIPAVGVFVNEPAEKVSRAACMVRDDPDRTASRSRRTKPMLERAETAQPVISRIIRAFAGQKRRKEIQRMPVTMLRPIIPLLDSGAKGTGTETFDWSLSSGAGDRPYFPGRRAFRRRMWEKR